MTAGFFPPFLSGPFVCLTCGAASHRASALKLLISLLRLHKNYPIAALTLNIYTVILKVIITLLARRGSA